jgi:hypothetical protein
MRHHAFRAQAMPASTVSPWSPWVLLVLRLLLCCCCFALFGVIRNANFNLWSKLYRVRSICQFV